MEVLVGIGVLVFRDGKVLLGKRKGSHGSSTWGLPGGHLEPGESIEECASRETAEETGLIVDTFTRVGFASDVFEEEQKHYVTLFVKANNSEGVPRILEPYKCESWQWFAWDAMPEHLFKPFRSFVNQGYSLSG